MSQQVLTPAVSFFKGAKVSPFTGQNSITLSNYKKQQMLCPVTGMKMTCFFLPQDLINQTEMNPMRPGGTPNGNITTIMDSLIAEPDGQVEPICVVWDSANKEFRKVFGFNRLRATVDANNKGFVIANHPSSEPAGIWAWIFSGTAAEETRLRMKENGGTSLPGKTATKQEMTAELNKLISQGGCDQAVNSRPNAATNSTPWNSLNDEQKYKRAKEHMKDIAPFWGGRKFKGIWNLLGLNNGGSTNPAGLNFKTWGKDKIAEFFCANSGKLGIASLNLNNVTEMESGYIVEENGKRIGLYFANSYSEIAGALPRNSAVKRVKENLDEVWVVISLNNSSEARIDSRRIGFETEAVFWNDNIMHTFDKLLFQSQTDAEMNSFYNVGKFSKIVNL